MKKITALLFSLFITLSLIPLGASAEVLETDSGIQYTVENGEVTLQGFNYAGTVMKVPEKIDGMTVKYVAPQACRGNDALTEVVLPSTVVSIGEYAFSECENLRTVKIEGGNSIGRSAFRDCKRLRSLSLPDNLISIDDFAFEGCTLLGKVKIPKSLEKLGTDAFAGCERLRFDLNGNDAAKEHAKKYNIPTSFTDTWEFTVILLVLVTVIIGGGVLVLNNAIKKKMKK